MGKFTYPAALPIENRKYPKGEEFPQNPAFYCLFIELFYVSLHPIKLYENICLHIISLPSDAHCRSVQ